MEFQFFFDRRLEILQQTLRHLHLTLVAESLAIFIGLTIGIILSRKSQWAGGTLAILGIIQTIPSLALLGFLLPLLGIGATPAIVALFLYALLPIVRNTFTGIQGINPAIREAAIGMGMTQSQLLTKIELPLAMPVIFAGIRTSVVICVGVATLCALIAAGGLGEFIFRGVALNHTQMVLAGAIPSALLALGLDGLLAVLQKYHRIMLKPAGIGLGIGIVIWVSFTVIQEAFQTEKFKVGFDAEFRERPDCYPNLRKKYGLYFPETRDLDAGLMYDALKKGEVNLISGYATDGRILEYQLLILNDDQKAFPPYQVAPLVYGDTWRKYPELAKIFALIANKISDKQMQLLNFEVDKLNKNPTDVAESFLKKLSLQTSIKRNGKAHIKIGGKKFTEQYILLEIFKLLIENYSDLTVEIKGGLGGTQIAFEALRKGEIDIYPEYSGTALEVILQVNVSQKQKIGDNPAQVMAYVKAESLKRFDVYWADILGFNNTYTLMMRESEAKSLNIKSISDLKMYLSRNF
jgi:osmoprotectant transport system permease protein